MLDTVRTAGRLDGKLGSMGSMRALAGVDSLREHMVELVGAKSVIAKLHCVCEPLYGTRLLEG